MDATPTLEHILAAYNAEEAALKQTLARVSDAQWQTLARPDGWTIHDIAAHIANTVYGIPQLIAHGAPPGGLDVDALNAQRFTKNRTLSRDKIEARIGTGFDAARQGAQHASDFHAPGPFGPRMNLGQTFLMIAEHAAGHRREIEQACREAGAEF